MALPKRDFVSKNGSSSSSSFGHRTDVRTDGRRSVVLTFSESEGGAVGPSEGGRRGEGWFSPCDFCGKAELDHYCDEAWKWREPIPEDITELAMYLAKVWGIRNAELVAIETSARAIADALLIVWRGAQDGRRYENPAGLIVKLARRITAAEERARRRR